MISPDKYRRITTSGDYFPELDGLRFLAISLVILYHINYALVFENHGKSITNPQQYWFVFNLLNNGWQGVQLFFVISGFILGLPFARERILSQGKVRLKSYYLRRLTRLEPPYIIAILFLFIMEIADGEAGFSQLLPGLGSSLVYMHNAIHKYDLLITVVAWSLEIEVQFYILAPFLAYLFYFKKFSRRMTLISLILLFPLFQFLFPLNIGTLYTFIQFFLTGYLLADLYTEPVKIKISSRISIPLGILLLILILYTDHHAHFYTQYYFLASVFLFDYLVLNTDFWKNIFSIKIISITGGMCYSVYLLHHFIICRVYDILPFTELSSFYPLSLLISFLVCYPAAIILSSFYFRLIEKPCMDKNWPRKLKRYLLR